MRIVQSFWSRPIFATPSAKDDDRSFGGWKSSKYYYMSWALSCLRLREYYDDVVLYTDTPGKAILFDKIKLPYASVFTALDALKDFDPYLWTTGKIVTYNLQTQPFIHVDGDIFVWSRFDKRIETAELLGQNVETNEQYYRQTVQQILERLDIPPEWRDDIKKTGDFEVTNTGIVGGCNIDFIQRYTRLALDIIHTNHQKVGDISRGVYGVTVEQSLFHSLARHHDVKIEYLFNNRLDYNKNPSLFRFYHVPSIVKFIHPLAMSKQSSRMSNAVEITLRNLYPEYYFRIVKLCEGLEL